MTQDFSSAETWLGSDSSQPDLRRAADNLVVNPYAIVSDQHLGQNRKAHLPMANQSKHYSQASVATPMNPSTPTTMADCEGDAISSPPVSAQRYETAVNRTQVITIQTRSFLKISNQFPRRLWYE